MKESTANWQEVLDVSIIISNNKNLAFMESLLWVLFQVHFFPLLAAQVGDPGRDKGISQFWLLGEG